MRAILEIDITEMIPEKKEPMGSELFNDYIRGWNDCVDEIREKMRCTIQKTDTST